MPATTRAVLFDIDGTLIDSVDAHAKAWQETFARHGYDIPFEDIRGQIGKGGDQLMPVFLPPDVVEARGEELQKERSDLFKRKFLPGIKPFPAVRDLFLRVQRAGLIVTLASSAKGDELETYKKIAGIEDLVE